MYKLSVPWKGIDSEIVLIQTMSDNRYLYQSNEFIKIITEKRRNKKKRVRKNIYILILNIRLLIDNISYEIIMKYFEQPKFLTRQKGQLGKKSTGPPTFLLASG